MIEEEAFRVFISYQASRALLLLGPNAQRGPPRGTVCDDEALPGSGPGGRARALS